MMRSARSEHILLAALLAVPLAVAFLGWSAFVRWAVGPSPQPTPEVAGATSVAAAPTPRPTVGAPPTITSRPTTVPTESATAEPVAIASSQSDEPTAPAPTPVPAAPGASDPSTAVEDFYARVAAHDFTDAATLWSPRMRAAFPPAQNIDQRFSRTRALTVQRAQVVSVDLDEATTDGQHHWSGTWSLVRGPDGWLLDQPQLQGA
jgi:cytoskeletal protein RodZ